MKLLLETCVRGIDRLSDLISRFVKYLIILLILVLCYEVVSRYIFNKPTVWALESAKMIFGAIGALCWGYTLKIGGHVRVDVFYTLLSKKSRAWIDVVMTVLFLFPFEYVLIYSSFKWAFFAVKTHEKMIDSSWMPPSAPFRFVLAIGFTLFFIQTLAEFAKNLYFIIKNQDLLGESIEYVKEDMI